MQNQMTKHVAWVLQYHELNELFGQMKAGGGHSHQSASHTME